MKNLFSPFILFLFISIISNFAAAQTIYFDGEILENTTWSADTVMVTGNIIVDENITLTIDPGTHVVFTDMWKIEVFGNLFAVGTVSDSIYFNAEDASVGWIGIKFRNKVYYSDNVINDSSHFKYCVVRDGKSECCYLQDVGIIYQHRYKAVYIENCSFTNNELGIKNEFYSSTTVRNCHFYEGGTITAGDDSFMYAYDNLFENNPGGCIHSSSGLVWIKNNQLLNNSSGISVRGGVMYIEDNIITKDTLMPGGGSAIKIEMEGTVFIKNNVISNHTVVGSSSYYLLGGAAIRASDNSHVFIYDNHIFGNKTLKSDGTLSGYGAILGRNLDEFYITNNRIHNNKAETGGAIFYRVYGTVNHDSTKLRIAGNEIFNNTAKDGGAIYGDNYGNTVYQILNNTICNNIAESGGGIAVVGYDRRMEYYNNIFWGNESENGEGADIDCSGFYNDPDYFSISFKNNFFENGLNGIKTNSVIPNDEFYQKNDTIYPDFVNPISGIGAEIDGNNADWSLGDLSVCQNGGFPNTSLFNLDSTDVNSNQRIVEDTIDIGASERQQVNYFVDYEFLIDSVAPNTTTANAHVDFNGLIRNKGNAVAPEVLMNFYISNDSILSGDDILYDSHLIPALTRIQIREYSIRTHLPEDLENGFYYLIGQIDPNNLVEEVEEDNNIVFDHIQVKNASIYVDPSSLFFEYQDSVIREAYVTATTGWNVKTNADWLHPVPEYGENYDTLLLITDRNPSYLERSTEVVIEVSKDKYDSIDVIQEGAPKSIEILPTYKMMECYVYDTAYFYLESSVPWYVAFDADWLDVTPLVGYRSDTIMVVTTNKNKSLSDRSCELNFYGLGESDQITIYQERTNLAQWVVSDGFWINQNWTEVTTDIENNIYVGGIVDTGDWQHSALILKKFDPAGNELWSLNSNTTGYKTINEIACDAANNIYVTGEFSDTLHFGGHTLVGVYHYSGGSEDTYVMKMSADGEVVWLKSELTDEDNNLSHIAIQDSTFYYLAGNYNDSQQWRKYNSNGELLWNNEITGDATIRGIKCTNDALYVIGTYIGLADFGDGLVTYGYSYENNIFVIKSDVLGNIEWIKTVVSTPGSLKGKKLYARDIELNSKGEILFLGDAKGSSFDIFGENVSVSSGSDFLAKLDQDGNLLSLNMDFHGEMIELDQEDNIYSMGNYGSRLVVQGTNDTIYGVEFDIYLIKYDSLQSYNWGRGLYGESFEYLKDFDADPFGNVYVVGSQKLDLSIDTIFRNTYGETDYFLAKFGSQVKIKYKADTTIQVCEGDTAFLTAELLNGSGPFNYKWYRNSSLMEDENNRILKVYDFEDAEDDYYQCMIENFNGIDTTGKYFLEIENLPQQPSSISGDTWVREETTQLYSVDYINGVEYTWILPEGWTGSSTTNEIEVVVGESDGDITVFLSSDCGDGPSVSLSIVSASETDCFPNDIDCDCDVDIVDITTTAYAYGTNVGDENYDENLDLDGDGDIDIVDITTIAYSYGWTCDGKKQSDILFETDLNDEVALIQKELIISDEFKELLIGVEDIYQLGAYELLYKYDIDRIEVLEILQEEMLNQTARENIVIRSEIDKANGYVYFAVTSLGNTNPGADGDGELFKIKYKTKSNSTLKDFNLQQGQLARIDAEIIPYRPIYLKNNRQTSNFRISPNPNQGSFEVYYEIEEEGQYELSIYSISGEKLHGIFKQEMEKGQYEIRVEGLEISSGFYMLCLLESGKIISSKKFIVK